jgi:ATP synthase protein I
VAERNGWKDRREKLARTVGEKERRKARARRRPDRSLLFGMGMFGLVGWSVALPTLAGLALGIWLDRRVPVPFSWTLTLLVAGVIAGCLNAWYWVSRESREE